MAEHDVSCAETSLKNADTQEDDASAEKLNVKMRIQMFNRLAKEQNDETLLMKPKIKNPVQQVKPPSTQATTLPIEETCHNCSTHEGTTSHATNKSKREADTRDTPVLSGTPIMEDTRVMEDTPNTNMATSGGRGAGNGERGTDFKSDEDVYRMDHPKRGVFIIINNRRFLPSTRMNERAGTDVDAANLYRLFMGLGFDVRMEHNKTTTEMLKIFDNVAREDHTDNDCFMCAILSHGDVGVVYGTDDIIKLDTLVNPFKGRRCPTLAGKPKVFIIQACRGMKMDEGVEVADSGEGSSPKIYRIPEEADFLYAYSTAPGYYSWRNGADGSWFIQALYRVFRNGSHRLEIMALLTKVNCVVAYEFQSNTRNKQMSQKKQIPSIVSMLTKELYLSPK